MLRSSLLILILFHLLACVFNSVQANNFTVSGGSNSPPFYQFTNENNQPLDFSTFKLVPGQTYNFAANGISADHPFMIGESYNDFDSSLVNGEPLYGVNGEISITIPWDYKGDLVYFCTSHDSMVQAFQISSLKTITLAHGSSFLFFENQYYKLTNSDRDLFISEQVGSNTVMNEVFPSRQVSSGEYLLFHAIHNSPRQFFYFDPNDLDFNGSIEVVSYDEKGSIVSSDLASEDYFGYGLAINDWKEIIASAPSKNSNSGAIYVFELDTNNQPTQKSILEPESGDEGWWGENLLVDGDFLFVGAPDASALSGKVLIYEREDENYTKQDEIIDPITGLNHSFGSSISFEANNRNLIISPNVEGSNRVGRVEVFYMDDAENFLHAQTLWSEDNASGNYFGIDHALSDQYLVVGAPKENNAYGRAYIFNRGNDGDWSNNPNVIVPSTGSPDDEFGSSVEIMDDFAFVGAKLGDGNVTNSGVVYVFRNEEGSWNEKAKLIPPEGDSNQSFSAELEVFDDLLVVTSIGAGIGGKAYIYKMYDDNESDWRLISALDNNGSVTSNDRSVLSVAANKGIVAIGSPEDSLNQMDGGSFKVFLNDGWQEHSGFRLDPLFVNQAPQQLNDIQEDSSVGISYFFAVEHPFESNFTFNVFSANTAVENYSISSDGNFSFIPEGNFSGSKSFTLEVNSFMVPLSTTSPWML